MSDVTAKNAAQLGRNIRVGQRFVARQNEIPVPGFVFQQSADSRSGDIGCVNEANPARSSCRVNGILLPDGDLVLLVRKVL
ncbi:hypothetical protein [Agrobacterium rubi]|uniref:hypothetical protein n=1 Tax=Agrobacterium rubi TaxID=28099 RepID=UPI001F243A1E|nr:hypothetical protein [Agrobacterium rubi]MBP1881492.1 hypothetical protein [Agrobacterium rubi]